MMNKNEQMNLQILCNAYAAERAPKLVVELKQLIDELLSKKKELKEIDKAYDKFLGKILGVSYAKGFADCHDKLEPKRNIFL